MTYGTLTKILLSSIALMASATPQAADDQSTTKPDVKSIEDRAQIPQRTDVLQNPVDKHSAKDVKKAMKKLDRDKDGTVSKTEAEKIPGLSEQFDVADKNKDGVLDSAELAEAMKAMHKKAAKK